MVAGRHEIINEIADQQRTAPTSAAAAIHSIITATEAVSYGEPYAATVHSVGHLAVQNYAFAASSPRSGASSRAASSCHSSDTYRDTSQSAAPVDRDRRALNNMTMLHNDNFIGVGQRPADKRCALMTHTPFAHWRKCAKSVLPYGHLLQKASSRLNSAFNSGALAIEIHVLPTTITRPRSLRMSCVALRANGEYHKMYAG